MDKNIMFQVGLNAKNYEKGVDRLKQKNNSLEDSIKKIGLAIGTAFGGYAALNAFKKSIALASDLEETTSKLNVVFGDLSKTQLSWIDKQSQLLGRSKLELARYTSDMQNLFVGFGYARDEAQGLSNNLVKLGYDLASFNNLSDEQTLRNLTSGLVGEHQALKSLGVVVNEVILKEEARKLGLSENIQELDEATKIQLRYNAVVSQSQDAIGDVIRTGDSYANQLKRLQGNVQDLGATFGSKFIPILADGIKKINEFFPKLEQFIQDPLSGLKNLWQNMGVVAKGVTVLIGAFLGIKTAGVAFQLMSVIVGSAGKIIMSVFRTLFSWQSLLLVGIYTLRVAWENNWFGMREYLTNVWENHLKPAFTAIQDIFKETYDKLKEVWNDDSLSPFEKLKDTLVLVGTAGWLSITTLGKAITGALGGNTNQYIETIEESVSDLKTALVDLKDAGNIGEVFSGLKDVGSEIISIPAKLLFGGFGDDWNDENMRNELTTLATNSAIFTVFAKGNLRVGLGLGLITSGIFGEGGSENPNWSALTKIIETGLGAKFLSGSWTISIGIAFAVSTSELQETMSKQIQEVAGSQHNPIEFDRLLKFGTGIQRLVAEGLKMPADTLQNELTNTLVDLANNEGILNSFMMLGTELVLIFVDAGNDIKEIFFGVIDSIHQGFLSFFTWVGNILDYINPFAKTDAYTFSMDEYNHILRKSLGGGSGAGGGGNTRISQGFATGGIIKGDGTGTSDSIIARVSNGEAIINAKATKKYGAILKAINENRFASGRVAGFDATGSTEPFTVERAANQYMVSLQSDIENLQTKVMGLADKVGLTVSDFSDLQGQMDKAIGAIDDMKTETIDMTDWINQEISAREQMINLLDNQISSSEEFISILQSGLITGVQDAVISFQDMQSLSNSFKSEGDLASNVTAATGMPIEDTDKMNASFTVLSNVADSLGVGFSSLMSSVMPFIGIMTILKPIIEGVMFILQPMINNLLSPLFNALGRFGAILATFLIPILNILQPPLNFLTMIVGFLGDVFKGLAKVMFTVEAIFQYVMDKILLGVNGFLEYLDWVPGVSGFLSAEDKKQKNRDVGQRINEKMGVFDAIDENYTPEPPETLSGDNISAGSTSTVINNIHFNIKENQVLTEDDDAMIKFAKNIWEILKSQNIVKVEF
ncbi:MAG: hypothetical protein PWQ45_94 [Thermosipho sp. (in: thermotogales)]|nr:hypothetical protein [Thermosipho sp. (in: thermotogales)]